MLTLMTLIITTAIAIKDYIFVNDAYVLRSISQGLCLIYGLLLLMRNLRPIIIRKYWLVFLYILILIVSGILSNHAEYVLFQVLSLTSVLIFAMAICEHNSSNIETLNRVAIIVLSVTVLTSFCMAIFVPKLAFSTFYEGDAVGNRLRFHGIYPKPAMIAVSSSILFGLGLFKINNKLIKLIIIAISLTCLTLTGSRTFWLAALLAVLLTILFYKREWLVYSILPSLFVLMLFGGYTMYAGSLNMIDKNTIRMESVSNLSGRTEIWKKSFDGMKNKPFLGYGFTTGSESLIDGKTFDVFAGNLKDSRTYGRSTVHNGYIQSILDSGFIGFALYISIIAVSIKRLFQYDLLKLHPEFFYVIIFYVIANLGESIIGSTASFGGFYIWCSCIIALSLYTPSHEPALKCT
jgi:O-antigen ligase